MGTPYWQSEGLSLLNAMLSPSYMVQLCCMQHDSRLMYDKKSRGFLSHATYRKE